MPLGVRELGVLEEASGGPDVLSGVQAVPGVRVADGGRSLARERQDLERPALWSLGRGLLGEPLAGPGVHGPPRGVGMAAEVSLGEIAVRDGAVDADVGERPTAPFSEGGGPAVPARVVFSAMALPHAVDSAALWRGGTRVRCDRAVEHLSTPSLASAARTEVPFGERQRELRPCGVLRVGGAGGGHGHRLPFGLALAASVQHEVGDLLRVGRGAADLPLVALQPLQPPFPLPPS